MSAVRFLFGRQAFGLQVFGLAAVAAATAAGGAVPSRAASFSAAAGGLISGPRAGVPVPPALSPPETGTFPPPAGARPVIAAADTAASDTSAAENRARPVLHSPRGALLRSAVLPGWGQWYNGKKWKSLLAAGGGLALAANAASQNRLMLDARTEDERAFYRNNRSLSVWWLAGGYFAVLLDAYVDAQLWHFDTGPDLSLAPGGGVRVGLTFRAGGPRR